MEAALWTVCGAKVGSGCCAASLLVDKGKDEDTDK